MSVQDLGASSKLAVCFQTTFVLKQSLSVRVYSYSLVQGFQTAFVGKAHATGRRCVDTALPLGFDCLICRRHSHLRGNDGRSKSNMNTHPLL